MSIWNAIVDVATNTAAKGAASLPAEGAGTKIWGFGATSKHAAMRTICGQIASNTFGAPLIE